MNRRRSLVTLLAISCVLLFSSGCETTGSRVQSRLEAYNGWDASTQVRLRQGIIQDGDSYDMVYVALGTPNEKDDIPVVGGETLTTWEYSRLVQRNLIEETVGYQEESEFDIKTGTRINHKIPIREKVSRPTKERGMLVIFRQGIVSSVQWGSQKPPPTPAPAKSK